MLNKILIFLSAFLTLTSYASGFFFGWGAADQSAPTTRYFYPKRFPQGTTYAVIDPERRSPIPSVPIQVPIPAQLTPVPNIHNVQLVPCLCPVSPENSYENQAHQSHQPHQPHYENLYFVPNSPAPQQQVQQQNVQEPQK